MWRGQGIVESHEDKWRHVAPNKDTFAQHSWQKKHVHDPKLPVCCVHTGTYRLSGSCSDLPKTYNVAVEWDLRGRMARCSTQTGWDIFDAPNQHHVQRKHTAAQHCPSVFHCRPFTQFIFTAGTEATSYLLFLRFPQNKSYHSEC